MHRSHLKLTKWFLGLYLVTQDKRGISATQLAISLGINYKAAWRMLTKIRAAMGQRDEQHLLPTSAALRLVKREAEERRKRRYLLHFLPRMDALNT